MGRDLLPVVLGLAPAADRHLIRHTSPRPGSTRARGAGRLECIRRYAEAFAPDPVR